MTRDEEWDELLCGLRCSASEEFHTTREYEYQKKRHMEIDGILETHLTKEQKSMVEDFLFELGLAEERKAALLYERGMKDCVWLLKNLGVLA